MTAALSKFVSFEIPRHPGRYAVTNRAGAAGAALAAFCTPVRPRSSFLISPAPPEPPEPRSGLLASCTLPARPLLPRPLPTAPRHGYPETSHATAYGITVYRLRRCSV